MWTITGQATKAMDATARSFATIGAQNPKVIFRSMAADTLTWSVLLEGLAPSAEIIPELGQEVALFRSGTRFFCGHVSAVRQSGRTVQVTVSNAWWWLERMFLQSTQTDGTGATGTRATFALPAQTLAASLTALANAAIAIGAPMTLGTLAATFEAPQLRLNQMSFAQAIGEVCRVTPDCVTWFDYAGTGLPALRTARRLTASVTTLDGEAVESFDLNPLTELQLTAVEIPYLVRAADGNKQFALQSAGTGAVGKTQLVTVSGDEMDTFLPKDLLDKVSLQTIHYVDNNFVATRDSYLAAQVQKWGSVPVGIGSYIDLWAGTDTSKTGFSYEFSGVNYQRPDGTFYTLEEFAGAYIVISAGSVPDWVLAQYGGIEVTISGTWIAQFMTRDGSGAHTVTQRYWDIATGGEWYSGFTNDAEFGAGSDYTAVWVVRPWSFKAVLINTGFTTATEVYRAADYGFAFPPEGFASGLLAAQNYIPYEGQVELMAEECGATHYLPAALSLSHTLPAHAAMAAMLASEELDLATGLTTLVLGPPARFSYRALVDRLRGSSNDNVIYV